MIKANGKYISVNWNSSGGGAFAVIPIKEVGKAPDQVPLFRGHTAQVLDTEFNPFNDNIVASASDDGKIGIWEIPEDYSLHGYVDEDGTPTDLKPLKMLSGHSRKVGHLLFHPTAENILASSSLDYTVKIWDISEGKDKFTLKHPDMVTSMSFSYDGNRLVTVSRDKKLRVWDIRAEKIITEGPAHSGAKNQRVVWLGNSERIATTGFSRLSDRQIGIWDAENIEKGDLGGFYNVDQSSGILMPFYDDSNKILYLAGKGDGNIRYFEFQNDELFELSEYQSTEPQRGFAVAPKRAVNVKENEVLKGFKAVGEHTIEPISFFVPRKSEVFQDDIYPDAPSSKPALTAEEWLSGKSVDGPILFKLQAIYDGSELEFTNAKKADSNGASANEKKKESSPTSTPPKSPSVEVKHEISVEVTPKDSVNGESTSSTPQSSLKKEVPSPKSTGKNQVDELLSKDASVDKLLQKATELDADNDAENPSEESSVWDSEDEKVTKSKNEPVKEKEVETKSTPEPVVKTESKEEPLPAETKETPPVKENAESGVVTTALVTSKVESGSDTTIETVSQASVQTSIKTPSKEPKEPKETNEPSKTSTSTPASASAGNKSLNLKQSVEKLSALVLQMESYIQTLTEQNAAKDERLAALEAKVEKLLQK